MPAPLPILAKGKLEADVDCELPYGSVCFKQLEAKNGSGRLYIYLQSSRLEGFCKIPEYVSSITSAWLSACGDLFSAADEVRVVFMGRRQCGIDSVHVCFSALRRGKMHYKAR